MGSRFGGDKQFTALGPRGETLMDYAIFDAARAGIERVVLIVRPDALHLLPSLQARYQGAVELSAAAQRLEDLPAGWSPPGGRTRPWGTSQAIWATRHVVDDAFLVVNGDDFYGATPYQALVEAREQSTTEWHLAGFRLRDTLSPSGPVNRAICSVDANGFLTSLEEVRGIVAPPDGDEIVSMNMWGLTPDIFPVIEEGLTRFLRTADLARDEYYLPEAISAAMTKGRRVRVLPAGSHWCGVTFPDDAPAVREQLAALAASSAYPDPLWS
jgi:NDP-sugar pyrophosphorylase family protein